MIPHRSSTTSHPEKAPDFSLPPESNDRSLMAWLRRTMASIRSKIIVPYLLLTVAIGAIGIYVVTRLIASSIEERFTNQLLEAGRVASDGLVRQESRHIEVLRPMTATTGVPEATQAHDVAALRRLIEVQA